MMRRDGGWLFVSYSKEDIHQVRQIRNTLEDNGFNPILFFLKCMEEGKDDKELRSLIHREIAARKWFVLLDSKHSRQSDWVQDEVAFVRRFPDKKVFTVDLGGDIDAQLQTVMRRTRVFLSYSHKDEALKDRLFQKLLKTDFLIWEDRSDLWVGSEWRNRLAENITLACKEGFVLLLITENHVHSENCYRELLFAEENHGTLVPVVVGDVELPGAYQLLLGTRRWLRISAEPSEEELDKIVDLLVTYFDK